MPKRVEKKMRYRVFGVAAACAAVALCLVAVNFSGSGALTERLALDASDPVYQRQVEAADRQDAHLGAGASVVPKQVVAVFSEGISVEEVCALVDDTPSITGVAEGTGSLEQAAQSPVGAVTFSVAENASIERARHDLESSGAVLYAQPNYRYALMDEGSSADIAADQEVGDASQPRSGAKYRAVSDREVSEGESFGADASKDALSAGEVIAPSSVSSNDPDRSKQWYLGGANVDEAWELSKGDGQIAVAVIDSGIAMNHPDLRDNIVAPYDVVGDNRTDTTPSVPDFSPDDELGHGTHVAGIACARADNGVGIAGVSFNANVVPIKTFYYSAQAAGYVTSTSDLISAYRYLLDDAGDGSGASLAQIHDVRVINMSLGALWEQETSGADQALLDAIDEADRAGILTVCAAGNDEYELPYKNWPSDYETCVSVVALEKNDRRASFSNYGPEKDIAAPGSAIYSCVPDTYGRSAGSYAYMNGTSMASPVVAGIAALVFEANPSITTDQAKDILYETAVDLGAPGKDDQFGYGKIDAAAAVRAAAAYSSVPVERIEDLPSAATAGVPVGLGGTVVPTQASGNILFSVKDPGTTGAQISGSSFVATHAGTAVLVATVIGGGADGGNYVQEFVIEVTGEGSALWSGLADVSWYNSVDTSFELATAEQLAGFAQIVNGTAKRPSGEQIPADTFAGKTVRLAADVALNAVPASGVSSTQRAWTPIADINSAETGESVTDVYFDGTFDGQGHLIENIYIDGASVPGAYGGYQGLFGALGEHAVVMNVGLSGGYIFGRVAGGIAAVSHVETSSQIPQIIGCFNTATVENYGSSSRGAGGIFGGENQAGSHAGTEQDAYRGACAISSCYNIGTIKGYLGSPAGGIAGTGSVVIRGCYNAGEIVSESSYIGSIAGMVYGKGAPTADVAVGFVADGSVESSFGLAGTCPNAYRYLDADHGSVDTSVAVADLLSADELREAAPLLGSSFVTDPQGGYPLLYWQQREESIDISQASVSAIEDQLYTGYAIVPDVVVSIANPDPEVYEPLVLTEGIDYRIECADNVEVGTAKMTIVGSGRYAGEIETTFQIVRVDLALCTIDPVAAQWLYGDPVRPSIVVRTPAGTPLASSNYTVSYKGNDAAGTATVEASGTGVGTVGSVSATFFVAKAADGLAGSGTKEDPYLVGTKGELQFVAHQVNAQKPGYASASYALVADIDAGVSEESPLACDPIGVGGRAFAGSFDGRGHTITLGLDSARVSQEASFDPAMHALALFGAVKAAEDAPVEISRVSVAGSVVSSGEAAGLIGGVFGGSVEVRDCANAACVTAGGDLACAGLLVFSTASSDVSFVDCTNEGAIDGAKTGAYYAAGIACEIGGAASFERCTNNGPVSANGHAGGIVCFYEPTSESVLSVESCANTASVSCETQAAVGSAGGLVGYIAPDGTKAYEPCVIQGSYNAGSVSAPYGTGGIIGRVYYVPLTIAGVYNTGSVTSTSENKSDIAACPGGIIGIAAYDGTWDIASAYNAGKIAVREDAGITRSAGAVIGYLFYDTTVSLDHVLFEAGCADGAIGGKSTLDAAPVVEGSAEEIAPSSLRAKGDTGAASRLGASFVDARPDENDDRPVLWWRASADIKSLEGALVERIADQAYTGMPVIPPVVLSDDGYTLIQGADYVVAATDNESVTDAARVAIIGCGRYKGVLERTFAIVPADIATCTIAPIPDQLAGPAEVEPALSVVNAAGVALESGRDYMVECTNNTEVGQASAVVAGVGNYTGSVQVEFQIVASKAITAAHISPIKRQTYTGAPLEPALKIVVDGAVLQEGKDYAVSYENNVSAGRASVYVTGAGRYTGMVTVPFTIVPASLESARILEIENQFYTGSPIEPDLVVTLNGRTLSAGTDYDVAYANNIAMGTASAVAIGKGNYTGQRTASFTIVAPEQTPDPPDPEKPALTVYVQVGSDESTRETARTFTREELSSIAAGHDEPAGGYLYSSDGVPKVIAAHEFVEIDEVLAQAGVTLDANDRFRVTDASRVQTSYECSAEELRAAMKFYPLFTNGHAGEEGARDVECAIALSWASAEVASTAGAAFAAACDASGTVESMRFLVGVTPDAYRAGEYPGNRFVNNVGSITVIKPESESLWFTDTDGHWISVEGWLDKVVERELMTGRTGEHGEQLHLFSPDDGITRAQMAVVLYRHACALDPSLEAVYGSTTDEAHFAQTAAFPDEQAGAYYTAAVNWAKDVGVLKGYEGPFEGLVRPEASATREEAAMILSRYAMSVGIDDAKAEGAYAPDAHEVAEWASDAVAWCFAHGVMTGNAGTGIVNPLGLTTRAEMAKMIVVIDDLVPNRAL